MTGQDDFFGSLDQDFISASDFGFWDETLECEGELGDFEFPHRGEITEGETPYEDPFLFLFEEDELLDSSLEKREEN